MTNVVDNLTGKDLGVTPRLTKHAGVPTLSPEDEQLKGKDYTSDQEVRWCPGCGDYVILNTIRNFLPDLGLRRDRWRRPDPGWRTDRLRTVPTARARSEEHTSELQSQR